MSAAGVIPEKAAAAGSKALYSERRQGFAAQEAREEARYNRISLARFLAFVAGLGVFLGLKDLHAGAALASLGAAILLFGLLVVRHERVLQRRERLRRLRTVNEHELERLEWRFERFDPGSEHLDPEHPYAADLDLFGSGSLFQLASRAHTGLGKRRLAAWLNGPAPPAEVRLRQAAVRELAPLLDWRQDFQALGLRAAESKKEPGAFLDWLEEPALVLGRPVLAIGSRLGPLVTCGSLLLGGLLALPALWTLGALLLLLQIGLNLALDGRVRRVHAGTSRQAGLFAAYAEMLAALEVQRFESEKLRGLQARLDSGAEPASRWIRRLGDIVRRLDLRYGMMHFPVNSLVLWDLRWVLRLERWKQQAGRSVEAWFAGIAEAEALASLAALAFDHPDWAMPELVDEPLLLEAAGAGHPLIPEDRRVPNDLTLRGPGQVVLVSGSNMAGKSTFLRALGTNAVLALAGGPACARVLRLSPLRLYTSMRTADSLGHNTSLFYAELQRLKVTIDAVARGEPVLFLLDEILKGTNSADRHRGSEALIRQLQRMGGSGLVATHDLELARLEQELPGRVRNFCFESEAHDGRLHFDYKLRPGVCRSLNAVKLMQSMGIEV